MKIAPLIAGLSFVIFGLALTFIPAFPEAIATTTTTITGWNVPSGTTFGNGLVALILPVAAMGAFAGIPLVFEQRGSIIVTMALLGFLVGSAAGMLSLTGSGPTDVTFAQTIIAALILGVWVWKGAE